MHAPGYSEFNETLLCDEDGTPVLVIGSRKFTVIDPQGDVSEYSRDSSIRLPDGFMWSPLMLKWANPVTLTTCSICRKPPFTLFRHSALRRAWSRFATPGAVPDAGPRYVERIGVGSRRAGFAFLARRSGRSSASYVPSSSAKRNKDHDWS